MFCRWLYLALPVELSTLILSNFLSILPAILLSSCQSIVDLLVLSVVDCQVRILPDWILPVLILPFFWFFFWFYSSLPGSLHLLHIVLHLLHLLLHILLHSSIPFVLHSAVFALPYTVAYMYTFITSFTFTSDLRCWCHSDSNSFCRCIYAIASCRCRFHQFYLSLSTLVRWWLNRRSLSIVVDSFRCFWSSCQSSSVELPDCQVRICQSILPGASRSCQSIFIYLYRPVRIWRCRVVDLVPTSFI